MNTARISTEQNKKHSTDTKTFQNHPYWYPSLWAGGHIRSSNYDQDNPTDKGEKEEEEHGAVEEVNFPAGPFSALSFYLEIHLRIQWKREVNKHLQLPQRHLLNHRPTILSSLHPLLPHKRHHSIPPHQHPAQNQNCDNPLQAARTEGRF